MRNNISVKGRPSHKKTKTSPDILNSSNNNNNKNISEDVSPVSMYSPSDESLEYTKFNLPSSNNNNNNNNNDNKSRNSISSGEYDVDDDDDEYSQTSRSDNESSPSPLSDNIQYNNNDEKIDNNDNNAYIDNDDLKSHHKTMKEVINLDKVELIYVHL